MQSKTRIVRWITLSLVSSEAKSLYSAVAGLVWSWRALKIENLEEWHKEIIAKVHEQWPNSQIDMFHGSKETQCSGGVRFSKFFFAFKNWGFWESITENSGFIIITFFDYLLELSFLLNLWEFIRQIIWLLSGSYAWFVRKFERSSTASLQWFVCKLFAKINGNISLSKW